MAASTGLSSIRDCFLSLLGFSNRDEQTTLKGSKLKVQTKLKWLRNKVQLQYIWTFFLDKIVILIKFHEFDVHNRCLCGYSSSVFDVGNANSVFLNFPKLRILSMPSLICQTFNWLRRLSYSIYFTSSFCILAILSLLVCVRLWLLLWSGQFWPFFLFSALTLRHPLRYHTSARSATCV